MNRSFIFDLIGLIPEAILAGYILALILFIAFVKEPSRYTSLIEKTSLTLCFFLCGIILLQDLTPLYTFNGFFVRDAFSLFIKFCITITSLCILSFSLSTLPIEKLNKPEYLILFLTVLLGMLLMISSNHFIALYLAIELQSIALYILAGFKQGSRKTSEASLKMFILGGVASSLLLFGLSFLYGITGSLNYQDVFFVFTAITQISPLSFQDPMLWSTFLGIIFVIVAFFFKIAAAPFHMWAPDVYEGVPLPVMSFLSLAPKIAAIAAFLSILNGPFKGILHHDTKGMLTLYPLFFQSIALLSIVWGSLGALLQRNIRRLLAYSSIAQIGFIVLSISMGSYSGIKGALLYTLIYALGSIGILGVLSILRYPAGYTRAGIIENIEDLQGLSTSYPKIAFALALFLFSMIGIPPFAGFFGKFYVFLSVIEQGYILQPIIALLVSVIAAFYYLRIIKYMYFEKPTLTLDINVSPFSNIPILLAFLGIALYSFYPHPLLWGSIFATDALLKG